MLLKLLVFSKVKTYNCWKWLRFHSHGREKSCSARIGTRWPKAVTGSSSVTRMCVAWNNLKINYFWLHIKRLNLILIHFLIYYNSGSQPGVRAKVTGGTRKGHRGYAQRSQGVRAKVTGGTQKLKKCSIEAILGRIFDLGVREGHIILILGYAEGTILIWGYAGTKRLRTPALQQTNNK